MSGLIVSSVAVVTGSAAAVLGWCLVGYFRVMRLLATRAKPWTPKEQERVRARPSVAVLLTVRNEAQVIKGRVENILEGAYPPGRFRLYVVSDGSTDGTDAIVSSFEDDRVILVQAREGMGKSSAQNSALSKVEEDVVVFTDADTVFMRDTIRRLVDPFEHRGVGCTTGTLSLSSGAGAIASGHLQYWRQEIALRDAESKLGVLAIATGACMAVRRLLIPTLDPCVGEDCTIPLAVVSAGYRVVHVSEARAIDAFESSVRGEWHTRIRMTERNWRGTWQYPGLLNVFTRPAIAIPLWSHKVLRWLSPFLFLIAALGGTFLGCALGFGPEMAAGWLVVGALLIAGALGQSAGVSLPLCGPLVAFGLANVAFAVGVLRGTTSRCARGAYR